MHLMIFVEIEEIFREDIGAQKKGMPLGPLEKFFLGKSFAISVYRY